MNRATAERWLFWTLAIVISVLMFLSMVSLGGIGGQ